MDLVDRWNRLAGAGRLQERVRALSSRSLPRPGPGFRALSLIGASLILGFWAQGISETEALGRWKREAAPSNELWGRSLRGLGFERLGELDRVHRVLRTLPTTLDSSHTAWTDQGRRWIALYDPLAEIRVYYRRRDKPGPPPLPQAQDWSWAGIGWDGFQEALERLEKPLAEPPAAPVRARHQARDPREIRY